MKSATPSLPLPQFGQDDKNHAALVVGKTLSVDGRQVGHFKRIEAKAAEIAQQTGLPLAFVCNTYLGGKDSEEVYGGGALGLVVALTSQGERPPQLDKKLLTKYSLKDIPESFWEEMQELGVEFEENSDPDEPTEGLILAPGGWSVATLYLGVPTDDESERGWEGSVQGEMVLTSASEDTDPGAVLTEELIQTIEGSSEPLCLEAMYC